jgi:hypothetical protein
MFQGDRLADHIRSHDEKRAKHRRSHDGKLEICLSYFKLKLL